MRTAEEILEKYWNKKNYMQAYFIDQQTAILTAINEARKEAIEETCNRVIDYLNENDIRTRYIKSEVLSLIRELK